MTTTSETRGNFGGLCYTPDCPETNAMGSSIYHAGNDRNRCKGCLDALDILIPAIPREVWRLRLVNDEAMSAHVRHVVALPYDELRERAAPLLERKERAYQDFARLARAAGDGALVRDLVARIVEVPHLVIDSTVTNFWVRHFNEARK
ncbi:hypothetical protein V1227_18765 [Lentzea sp. DG1S-22]|uniref:hypothetical protein n=1 Tax=Lentzea sp. DG1S-22 TaxID=3108822 RepID=UPI002E79656E|nr:hypothetical protein [Lentzea sp. DG1S-22]WVH84697.1 hypothetical protein V1227_18765 [Lentzea sp. DG1S-22]